MDEHRSRRCKGAIWEHFEEIAPRLHAGSHPRARCKYCHARVNGQPKAKMIPHLIKRCPQVPPDVKQQWLEYPSTTRHPAVSTRSNSTSTEASEMESGMAAENMEVVIQAPEPQAPESQGLHFQTQSQRLEILRIKANVAKYKVKAMEAKYQAMAMEAEYMAEKLAARVKLQDMGIPEDEIEQLVE